MRCLLHVVRIFAHHAFFFSSPIMQKLYGGAGAGAPGGFPGGAPGGFPGGAPGGFPGGAPGGFPGAGGEDGPTVEEVD